MGIGQRLNELGLILPTPAQAIAAYVPYVISDGLVFISGQLPMEGNVLPSTGRVSTVDDIPRAQRAARQCAINVLAQLHHAVAGDWDKVERCVRLGGFIATSESFFNHAKVMNGASELIEQVMGDAGKHARTTIGVSSLPLNATVEVEALFSLRS